jgi:hypothetical protein
VVDADLFREKSTVEWLVAVANLFREKKYFWLVVDNPDKQILRPSCITQIVLAI